uniref:Uncharacterized protein n=1 Tax=Mandrillus leucophaeus TaxID=9568 RepID=A0A2K5XAG3_MANLE
MVWGTALDLSLVHTEIHPPSAECAGSQRGGWRPGAGHRENLQARRVQGVSPGEGVALGRDHLHREPSSEPALWLCLRQISLVRAPSPENQWVWVSRRNGAQPSFSSPSAAPEHCKGGRPTWGSRPFPATEQSGRALPTQGGAQIPDLPATGRGGQPGFGVWPAVQVSTPPPIPPTGSQYRFLTPTP